MNYNISLERAREIARQEKYKKIPLATEIFIGCSNTNFSTQDFKECEQALLFVGVSRAGRTLGKV